MSEEAKNLVLHFGKGTREAARPDRGLAAMCKYLCCRSPNLCSFWKRCKDSSKITERFSENVYIGLLLLFKPCLTVPLGEVEEKRQGPHRKGRSHRGSEKMPTSSCGKWRGLRLLACNYREIQVAANYEGCYHGNINDDEYYGGY